MVNCKNCYIEKAKPFSLFCEDCGITGKGPQFNESIEVILQAENTNGTQELVLTSDLCNLTGDQEYWFKLTGTYKEQPIQIDFNTMDRNKLKEIRAQIDLILEIGA
jgi:molybdenum cofactor biosynthesis enzyme MoaA